MDDNELLESAAKAAGWSFWQSKHGYLNVKDPRAQTYTCCEGWPLYDPYTGEKLRGPSLGDALAEIGWIPLIDATQALDLAVKLKIGMSFEFEPGFVVAGSAAMGLFREELGDNPNHAVCRAIVRAAASAAPTTDRL